MQQSFSDLEYKGRRRQTRKDIFLDQMESIIPWSEWIAAISPFYYPDRTRGRKPLGLEKMLRMYLLQCWFNLSDEGVEDAIYDSYAMRKFMGLNFLTEQVPDATTLLHFRHMLEACHAGQAMFDAINRVLDANGLLMHGGTIIDATIINAPSSTKNQDKSRDPEMHQTKKGNEWRFGMKAHVGVDAGTGYVTGVTATAANVHDIVEAKNLLRPDDDVAYGDSGYLGIENREEIRFDPHLSQIDYRINRRPGTTYRKAANDGQAWEKTIERQKSSVRSKVEHPFRFVKVQCGFRKTVYRGIRKNLNRLHVLFASANLYACVSAGRKLIPQTG